MLELRVCNRCAINYTHPPNLTYVSNLAAVTNKAAPLGAALSGKDLVSRQRSSLLVLLLLVGMDQLR